jgi:hypothetical protein
MESIIIILHVFHSHIGEIIYEGNDSTSLISMVNFFLVVKG